MLHYSYGRSALTLPPFSFQVSLVCAGEVEESIDSEEIDCSARVAIRCGPGSSRRPPPWTSHERIQSFSLAPTQWGAAYAEIKVPSGENTELKRSPFKAWSRSVYSHTCHAYCQGFLPCLFLPFRSIHLHFFQNFSRFFRSCVGPQNKIGHPAGYWFPC